MDAPPFQSIWFSCPSREQTKHTQTSSFPPQCLPHLLPYIFMCGPSNSISSLDCVHRESIGCISLLLASNFVIQFTMFGSRIMCIYIIECMHVSLHISFLCIESITTPMLLYGVVGSLNLLGKSLKMSKNFFLQMFYKLSVRNHTQPQPSSNTNGRLIKNWKCRLHLREKRRHWMFTWKTQTREKQRVSTDPELSTTWWEVQ